MFHLVTRAFPYICTALIVSLCLIPIVKIIGLHLGIYAVENNRTVHHGKIVRIGGLGIFLAFIITMAFFVESDDTINAMLIGAAIVFAGGLLDDIFDLKPLVKMAFQIAGALIAVYKGGIILEEIDLGFIYINFKALSFIVSVFWIVGVCNAINLIDGLDGLSSGISIIVLCVIGLIAQFQGYTDVCIISLILVGAIGGFLPYNFHPASIFVGDSGALFMGYMIACLSLLGFKTSTFITLGFPIIILFVPLMDTTVAIIRRKLSGHKIMEADRSHLHHVLLYKIKLSHTKTVLVLYLVTFLFGTCAIVMYLNHIAGMCLLTVLCCIAWMFIELTGMLNPNFHPVIALCRRITGYPKKSDDAFFEANKIHHTVEEKK